jgi:hypothetical protein
MSHLVNLNGPYSIGEEAFAAIENVLRSAEISAFVEFGSGGSTVRIAKAFPSARILSVESGDQYFKETQSLIEYEGLEKRVQVVLRELTWVRFGWGAHLTYRPGDFPGSIDAVLIDGPPGYNWRGREACLYQVFDRVRTGGIIILDDYSREREQADVFAWSNVYRGCFLIENMPVGHGLCVLRKTSHQSPRWFAPSLALINLLSWYRLIRNFGGRVFRFLTKKI